jgi:y4mF family transcriptional regulator
MTEPSPNEPHLVRSVSDLGRAVRAARKRAGADQITTAGLAGVGPRFLGELEAGKPTLRLGLVLQVLHRLGLELWVAPRGTGTPRSGR